VDATTALAAGSAVVAAAFTLSLLERWLTRRRRHELAWTGALALFTAGALSLWAGAALGWDGWSFRLFYGFGAVLNVPFLALGSVYLLAGTRVGDRIAVVLVPTAGFALGVVLSAPFTAPVDGTALPQGSDVFGPAPRILAAVASGVGATVVFAGALWSIFRLVRSGGPRQLAIGNGLIAAGTATLSASGLLNSALGEMESFAATLAIGVTILFAGFLVTATRPARHLKVVLDEAATVSAG
jgi:hypothetical protein